MSEVLYIRVDPELKRRIEDHLRDPVTGGLQQGAISHLGRRLFTLWCDEQDNNPKKASGGELGE